MNINFPSFRHDDDPISARIRAYVFPRRVVSKKTLKSYTPPMVYKWENKYQWHYEQRYDYHWHYNFEDRYRDQQRQEELYKRYMQEYNYEDVRRSYHNPH